MAFLQSEAYADRKLIVAAVAKQNPQECTLQSEAWFIQLATPLVYMASVVQIGYSTPTRGDCASHSYLV